MADTGDPPDVAGFGGVAGGTGALSPRARLPAADAEGILRDLGRSLSSKWQTGGSREVTHLWTVRKQRPTAAGAQGPALWAAGSRAPGCILAQRPPVSPQD